MTTPGVIHMTYRARYMLGGHNAVKSFLSSLIPLIAIGAIIQSHMIRLEAMYLLTRNNIFGRDIDDLDMNTLLESSLMSARLPAPPYESIL